ncbi:MAG: 3'-5' exonuclease [Planctomycetota bacterium]
MASEADNVVRLMTIHKAKGLEFPVVIVPDLNSGVGPSHEPLPHRSDWGWTFNAPVDIDAAEDDDQERPLSFRLASAAESRDEKAEMIRKYYVALTRHEDHLVLVGADWRTKDGRVKNSDSFLTHLDGEMGLLDAIDAGKTEIGYSWDGQEYQAALMRCPSPTNRPTGQRQPLGRKLLAAAADGADLAANIIAATTPTDDLPLLATSPLPLIGPIAGY